MVWRGPGGEPVGMEGKPKASNGLEKRHKREQGGVSSPKRKNRQARGRETRSGE